MFKKGRKIITSLLLAGICAGACVAAWPEETAPDQVTAADMHVFVEKLFKKKHVAGSVAVIKNGHVQVVNYGLADAKKKIKNGDRQVVYPAASMQKEVTGAMVMQLMEEKKGSSSAFSQNTKISRWYPALKNAKKISVGNLLSHTSGLQIPDVEVDRHINYSEDQAVKWIVTRANQLPQDKVGSYHYSDVNYILLAGIIKKVSHKSYAWNFKKRVVQRLGLTSTYVSSQLPKNKKLAVSYRYQHGKNYQQAAVLEKTRLSQLVGAGNMLTTAGDYYLIQEALGTGQFLSPSAFHQLTHLKSKINRYSGGVYLKKGEKVKLAYGAIGSAHYAAYFQLTADNKNGIILLLNQRSFGEDKVKDVGYQILKEIMFDTFSKT
ncbi:serine hydrolase domain-containing protein [Lactobacillus sp.]|uniref:serine hydrolase domain-containing protein n=1 Tax=Lactobacillus sp. TaxID=1591 RepID=UPI003F0D5D62